MNRKRFALLAISIALFAADTASAAPTWLQPQSVSAVNSSNSAPDIAVNARGDAAAVWVRGSGASATLQASTRPAGGAWHAPVTPLSGTVIGAPRVGIDGEGHANVIWVRSDNGKQSVWTSASDPGGGFSVLQQLDSCPAASEPTIAVNEHGDALAAWTGCDGNVNGVLVARFRPAGGGWGGFKQLTPTGNGFAASADVAIDPDGRAVVTWSRDNSIQAAFDTPGSGWGKSDTIAQGNQGAVVDTPRAAIDASGRATVLWRRYGAAFTFVEAAEGTASAGWAQGKFVPGSGDSREPDVAVAQDGHAVAAWKREENGHTVIVAALRPAPGADWDATVVSDPMKDSGTPSAAIDPQGNALVAWDQKAAVGHLPYASYWLAHGYGWDAQHALAAPAAGDTTPRVAFDSGGDAVAAFVRGNPIQTAQFDAAPVLSNIQVPATGAPGETLAFSASATDLWSALTIAWDFGDGATAPGSPASHAYAAPGDYTVTVTARDAVGNEASAARVVHVQTPAAPSDPPPPVSSQPQPQSHAFAGLLIKRQRIVVRRGIGRVRAMCPFHTAGACVGTLRLVSGKKVASRARFNVKPGRTVRIRVRLRRVPRALRASATAHDGLGAKKVTSAKLQLRRK